MVVPESDTDIKTHGSAGDFRRFWVAGAADRLGTCASAVVLPLLLLSAGAGPVVAGLVGTCAGAAQILCTPVAGVLADRCSRRRMMVLAAMVCVGTSATVTALVLLDRVSLPLIAAATVLQGIAVAVYSAAASGAARAILPAGDPRGPLAALRARDQAVQMAGPGLGGALYQLGRWVPFLVDAVSYLVAALCVGSIKGDLGPSRSPAVTTGDRSSPDAAPQTDRSRTAGPAGFWGDLREGIRFLFKDAFLRFVAIWSAGINLVFGSLYFHVVLQARLRGESPTSIGLVLTIAGAGGVLGALLAPVLLTRLRAGVVVLWASWGTVLLSVALALTTSTLAYGALLSSLFIISPALSVLFQSRAILATPDCLQGRVGTVLKTVGEGTAALAPLVAGLGVEYCDARTTALIVGTTTAALACYATGSATSLGPARPAGGS